jgi:hypothetical protein
LYPDKVFDRPEHMEFISLHLTESAANATTPPRGDTAADVPRNPS